MAVPETDVSLHACAPRVATAVQLMRQRMRAAYEAVSLSLRPTSENAWLVNAQLDMCRQSVPQYAIYLLVATFVVSQLVSPWISWPVRMTWWLSASVACFTADWLAAHFDKACDGTLEATRRRARLHVAATVVVSLAWASMSVFLRVPGAEINHVMLAVILACSLAGSTVIASPHPTVAATNVLIYAVFLVGPFAASSMPLDRTAAWLAAIYVVMMAGAVTGMHGRARKLLILEHERQAMVDGLQRAKEESDREHERAVAAGRTKSQFLSNMNHELRTPMNAILGFSELIQHKSFGNAVDKYAEYAEIIHDAGQRLLALIDDMFDLAKIDAGKVSLRETTVDLAGIIADAVDSHEAKANEGQISLEMRILPGFPSLHADHRAMRQIVGNLISNAVKFTPAGGSVIVFAHVEADGRLAFGTEDSGIGIAEDDQASVFERFGRGRHDVVTMTKGTGLGLAVVKGFAEAHDGEVKLESALGEGTRVTVYMPAARAVTQPTETRCVA